MSSFQANTKYTPTLFSRTITEENIEGQDKIIKEKTDHERQNKRSKSI